MADDPKPNEQEETEAPAPDVAEPTEAPQAAEEQAAEEQAAEAAEAPEPKKPARKNKDDEAAAPAEPKAQPKRRGGRTDGDRPVVRAQAKYVRTSARKARLVCDHIRGKSVEEARAILAMTPRAVASDWSKLLESAIANAENNHELVGDDLRILSVHADEGPTLKRFRPRAMGRATRIRKRTSHLTIMLTPKE
jgi:ribosomal protein L22